MSENDSITKSCNIMSCLFGIKMEDKEQLIEIKKTFEFISSKGNEVEIIESYFDSFSNRKARKFFQKKYDLKECALKYTNHLTIHRAAQRGDLYSLKCFIIILKNNVNLLNSHSSSLLHEASLNGHLGIVIFLIKSGSFINAINKEGLTPLHFACNEGHIDIVKILLNNNCSIDVQNNFGSTPMHYASRNRHKEIINLLLKKESANKRK